MPTNYSKRLGPSELHDLASYLMDCESEGKQGPHFPQRTQRRRRKKKILNETREDNSASVSDGTLSGAESSAQQTRGFKLEPLSPKFLEFIARDAKLETVATGFGFTKGRCGIQRGFSTSKDNTINKIWAYSNGQKEDMISLGDPDGNTPLIANIV